MSTTTNKKPMPALFKAIMSFGNLVNLAGFALLLIPKLAPDIIPPPISEQLSVYPNLAYILIGVGFAMLIIPRAIQQLRPTDIPPTADQIKAQQRIDEILKTDPVAQKIEWSPAKSGGNSFQTHKAVAVGNQRIELKITKGAIMTLVGSFLFPIVIVLAIHFRADGVDGLFFIFAAFSFMGAASLYTLFKLAKPRVMDKNNGWFWTGYGLNDDVGKISDQADSVRLIDVYAIQLLSEKVSHKNSEYNSYELNLVLKDSSRVNILDHNDLGAIREDAQKIATFLNVNVWQKAD